VEVAAREVEAAEDDGGRSGRLSRMSVD